MSLRRVISFCCALLLSACAGGPPAPDWQANAHTALAAHTSAYLAGRDRIAAQELAAARREVSRTGDATQMARVELTACAMRIASLDGDTCSAFVPLAADADAATNAYAAYLAGHWQGIELQLLPAAQRDVPRTGDATALLGKIAEPLPRLLAAALLLRDRRLPPAGIALAIETAAQQGWRRPLLAWLGLERDRLIAAGDKIGADKQQRRIERIVGAPVR